MLAAATTAATAFCWCSLCIPISRDHTTLLVILLGWKHFFYQKHFTSCSNLHNISLLGREKGRRTRPEARSLLAGPLPGRHRCRSGSRVQPRNEGWSERSVTPWYRNSQTVHFVPRARQAYTAWGCSFRPSSLVWFSLG